MWVIYCYTPPYQHRVGNILWRFFGGRGYWSRRGEGGGGSIWFARRVLFGVVLFVVLSERGLGWLGVFVGLEGWMDGWMRLCLGPLTSDDRSIDRDHRSPARANHRP